MASLIDLYKDLELDNAKLRAAAEHIAFPPKLPQEALDRQREVAVESAICALTAATARYYAGECASDERGVWTRLAATLQQLGRSLAVPLDKDQLFDDVRKMREQDIMVLHIREQNACVIIRKQAFSTLFEVFEIYPPTSIVMATTGKLVRVFPGSAVEVDEAAMRENGLLEQVVSMLSKLDVEVMQGSVATSSKGGTDHREIREAADPHYISELFLGILLGYGRRVTVCGVNKRIADDVLWKSALKPWRRSPAWLMCRVLLQTTVLDIVQYKGFMLFLHTKLLAFCSQRNLEVELLFSMQAKSARRLDKLRTTSIPEFVRSNVLSTFHQTQEALQSWWQKTQARCQAERTTHWAPETLDFKTDTLQSLATSHRHLQDVVTPRRPSLQAAYTAEPLTPSRIQSSDFKHYADGKLKAAVAATHRVALADFETAVRTHVDTWVAGQKFIQGVHVGKACATLAECFVQYNEAAKSEYAQDPLDLSIYALTILELWVAIDRLAVASLPLLARYPPEIPTECLHPLLLRTKDDLGRADVLETYVRNRRSAADIDTSIFTDKADALCFAVKYFQASPTLQALKRTIEVDADAARRMKLAELTQINSKYEALHAQSLEMDHEDFWIKKKRRTMHVPGRCQRCKVEAAAEKLKIEVHEWPLPSNVRQAEATVFELRLPLAFAAWRCVTYMIMVPIGTPIQDSHAPAFATLPQYGGLAPRYGQFHHCARVTIASETKSVLQSHYSCVKAPASEDAVCVGSGLKYRLYDTVGTSWAAGPFSDFSMAQYGTLVLPSTSPYSYLSYSVKGTQHTTNHVIADRASCPKDLTLQEHDAFGSLRSGGRLQWMNILCELEAGSLTLRNEEVYTLLTQTAWQLGPIADDGHGREWHEEIKNSGFLARLYEVCLSILSNVQANWREVVTVRVLVDLTLRGLAAGDPITREAAYALLREARKVGFAWLLEVKELLLADDNLQEDEDRAPYRQLACELALLCRKTFDVGNKDLPSLLRDHEDVRVVLECAIAIWENRPTSMAQVPVHLRSMFSRDTRLAHRLQPILATRLVENWTGLTSAVLGVWPDFVPGSRRGLCSGRLWFFMDTASRVGRTSQRIHYNILNGQLLVNGKPLGRLPVEVTSHSFYVRTFGKRMFDVVPADTVGMQYATRTRIKEEYQILFSADKSRLRIQARTKTNRWEILPHGIFRDDFSHTLVEDCSHWVDLTSHELEFRPLQDQWRSSTSNWKIAVSTGSRQTQLATRVISNTELEYLVDYKSPAFKMLSQRLSSLEKPSFMQIIYVPRTGLAYVTLSRLKLRFTLAAGGELESDDLPSMIVDTSQSLGTLVGLRNQLVLCHKSPALHHQRCVLIPHGSNVRLARDRGHVQVAIDTSDQTSVLYHRYDVDHDLGRLTTHAGLTSRLFKIYLHAITSSCLPDPLTHQTGVEQALWELTSSASYSSMALHESDVTILKLIGSLTPIREFYPAHLRCMATTRWNPALNTFSQHSAWAGIVQSILQHSDALRIFHQSAEDLQGSISELHREPHLLGRAFSQSRHLYPSDMVATPSFGSNGLALLKDKAYTSRARDEIQLRSAVWAVRLAQTRNAHIDYELVGHIIESCTLIDDPDRALQLGYHADWMSLSSSSWLALYDLCRQTNHFGRAGFYRLTFALATMSYSCPEMRDLVPACIAAACNRRLYEEAPPPWISYELQHGFGRDHAVIVSILVDQFALPLPNTPAETLERRGNENMAKYRQRKLSFYNTRVQSRASSLASFLLDQDQLQLLQLPVLSDNEDTDGDEEYATWFDVRGSLKAVAEYFTHCAHNADLLDHLDTVQAILRREGSRVERHLLYFETFQFLDFAKVVAPDSSTQSAYRGIPLLVDRLTLLGELSSCHIPLFSTPWTLGASRNGSAAPEAQFVDLTTLIEELRCGSGVDHIYGSDLMRSLNAAKVQYTTGNLQDASDNSFALHALDELVFASQQAWQFTLSRLQSQVHIRSDSNDNVDDVLDLCGLLPRMTLVSMFRLLSFHTRSRTSAEQRGEVIYLARCFILYQHALRMRSLAFLGHREELAVELRNWRQDFEDESEDDLLLQIDGNFRIRHHQLEVAREMIRPSSGSSSVYQVNMGEGKTSVITPMVVCGLADGRTLARVVVLKALSAQMETLLVTRLGGIVNRRVFYLPFSRSIDITEQGRVQAIEDMFKECALSGGVLLAQPEHILSLKLMSIHVTISDQRTTARQMQGLQQWLCRHSRDVLDESDELLHVQYQLIYTHGTQRPVDHHPDRWICVQQLLTLVGKLAPRLYADHPTEVEFVASFPGRFPALRLLRTPHHNHAYTDLKLRVAAAILAGDMPLLNLSHITEEEERLTMIDFFTSRDISKKTTDDAKELCQGSWKGILLVRGLLAFDVLQHVLQDKRYRVNYGLDLSRSLLAVPYAAKDMPSPRAEFSHPDVAIALTAMAYYAGGLTEEQLLLSFNALFHTDDPMIEYSSWVEQDPALPQQLRRLNGINTKDIRQFHDQVYPAFSHNRATVDFFLAQLVFPKEAREFPYKLSTSGWDLAPDNKTHVTTGFSGTNDRRHLLPASIEQRELNQQSGTSASVLQALLRPENNHYRCMVTNTGRPLGTCSFLDQLVQEDPQIRVLLDVGAQMLELQNQELVAYWLSLRPKGVSAAIFFNERDELTVLSEDGTVQPFESSSYQQAMDRVVVYLDDAHTRGTDLKLPRNTRAAVTLGPKVTKDRLVQGCMRMRRLGNGQSVVFFAPVECNTYIRAAMPAASDQDAVQAKDILRWVMKETCDDIRHYVPHWAQQGLEYIRRSQGERNSELSENVDSLRQAWLTPEGRRLEDMYGTRHTNHELMVAASKIPALRSRLRKLGITNLEDPHLDEEQEREISHEVERQRQIERPAKMEPTLPTVSPGLQDFIISGILGPMAGLQRLMSVIWIPEGEHGAPWSANLLATADFFTPVVGSRKANTTSYGRPVWWILSSKRSDILVVLSPYEVNSLLPSIRRSQAVHLHVYTPRVVQDMRSFSDLRFYSIPPLPPNWTPPTRGVRSQLNLFSGQLYFDTYQEYFELCAFLGAASPESSRLYRRGRVPRRSDGFVWPSNRSRTMNPELRAALSDFGGRSFHFGIIGSLKTHVSLRRSGMDFTRTHVGRLLHGRQLSEDDFADGDSARFRDEEVN